MRNNVAREKPMFTALVIIGVLLMLVPTATLEIYLEPGRTIPVGFHSLSWVFSILGIIWLFLGFGLLMRHSWRERYGK